MENKKKLCDDCKKNKAIIEFSSEPFLAISHGWGIIPLCRSCYIKRIERELGNINKNLEEQKLLFSKTTIRMNIFH